MGRTSSRGLLRLIAVFCLIIIIVVMTALLVKPSKEPFAMPPLCNQIAHMKPSVCQVPSNIDSTLTANQKEVLQHMQQGYVLDEDIPDRCKQAMGCVYPLSQVKEDLQRSDCSFPGFMNAKDAGVYDAIGDSCFIPYKKDDEKAFFPLALDYIYKTSSQNKMKVIKNLQDNNRNLGNQVTNQQNANDNATKTLDGVSQEINDKNATISALSNTIDALQMNVANINKANILFEQEYKNTSIALNKISNSAFTIQTTNNAASTPTSYTSTTNMTLGNIMTKGQSLTTGQALTSSNNKFTLRLQGDGNLVVYNDSSQPLWATSTNGLPNPILTFKSDGSLVLASESDPSIIARETSAYPTADKIILQNDGNFVLYGTEGNNTYPLWDLSSIKYAGNKNWFIKA